MPYLAHLCRRCTHSFASMMPYSFDAAPTIWCLFCCTHRPASFTHLFYWCIDFPASLTPSTLLYLSSITVVLRVWCCHPHQPAYLSPLFIPRHPASTFLSPQNIYRFRPHLTRHFLCHCNFTPHIRRLHCCCTLIALCLLLPPHFIIFYHHF